MDISIIIPSYKPKEYLWDCLNSICAQTLAKDKFEIILVLNGCCEPYHSEIQSYISQHPNISWKYIQTDLPGVSNARNIALDAARGQYITFIDDDDLISKRCLEEMLSLQNGNTIVECYPYAFNDGDITKQVPYGLTNVYDYCLRHHCNKLNSHARKFLSGPCMKLIPYSYIKGKRFNTMFKNGEDSLFIFSISNKIKKIALTSKEAVYYRRYRRGSAVMSKRSASERITNSLRCIMEYIKIYKPWSYSLYFFLSRIVAEIICILIVVLKKQDKR